MENNFVLSQMFISGLILLGVWVMFQHIRREKFRIQIRDIRDELFDWMLENKQDFTSPEYANLRQTLNGLMRLSSRIGRLEAFGMICIQMSNGTTPKSDIDEMPDSPLKAKLQQVRRLAVRAWFTFLFKEGLLGAMIRCANAAFKAVHIMTKWKQFVIVGSERIMFSAHEFGAPKLTAAQRMVLSR